MSLLEKEGLEVRVMKEKLLDAFPQDVEYLAIFSPVMFFTDRGILLVNTTLFGGEWRSSDFIDVNSITSLTFKVDRFDHSTSNMMSSSIKIIGAGDQYEQFSDLPAGPVNNFVNMVQKTIAGRSTATSTVASPNASERLRSLAELKEQGLLSESEFEVKRAEILGEL